MELAVALREGVLIQNFYWQTASSAYWLSVLNFVKIVSSLSQVPYLVQRSEAPPVSQLEVKVGIPN